MASVIMQNYVHEDEDIKALYGGNRHSAKRRNMLKLTLNIFLTIVLIGGLAILGIGLWTLEAEYGSKELSRLISANLYRIDSYLMIISGSAVIAITILGFFGNFTQYKCLMGLHLGLLAFMSVMLFVAGILGYVLIAELEDKVKEKMEDVIVERYGIPNNDQSKTEITNAWDSIQQSFECCGAHGGPNSTTSWALYKTRSQWSSRGFNNHSLVPDSCCANKQNLDLCTGKNGTVGPPVVGPPINVPLSSLNYFLYTRGCFDALEVYLNRTGVVIGTCAIVVGVFLLVELVLSICMYRTIPGR